MKNRRISFEAAGKLLVFSFLVLCVLAAAGCGKDNPVLPEQRDILTDTKWETSITADGFPMPSMTGNEEDAEPMSIIGRLEFRSSGRVTLSLCMMEDDLKELKENLPSLRVMVAFMEQMARQPGSAAANPDLEQAKQSLQILEAVVASGGVLQTFPGTYTCAGDKNGSAVFTVEGQKKTAPFTISGDKLVTVLPDTGSTETVEFTRVAGK